MKRPLVILMLVAVAATFVLGVGWLLQSGLASGRHYPVFSSLRHDPLGASALRLALNQVDGVQSEASLLPLRRLNGEPGVLFIAGYKSIDESDQQALQDLVSEGWRAVIAFGRSAQPPENWQGNDDEEPPDEEPAEDVEDAPAGWQHLTARLQITQDEEPLIHASVDEAGESAQLAGAQQELALPAQLPWPSDQVFEEHPDWTPVYLLNGAPAVVSRRYESGEVIALADGYQLLNEALKSSAQTEFLAWLIGPARRVVFYEHHLGISEQPGMGSLVGTYGLWPFIVGALAWFLLLFWKNASAFGPPPPEAAGADEARGVASGEGLARLLERHVPIKALPELCLEEFSESLGRRQEDPRLGKRLSDARLAMKGGGSPSERYNRAADILRFRQS